MSAASIMLIYCPFPSLEAASTAAKTLLGERLIACCNILPETRSLYTWQNVLTETSETILIAKTSEKLTAATVASLTALHPYECPAILSFPANANSPFAQWLAGAVDDFATPSQG